MLRTAHARDVIGGWHRDSRAEQSADDDGESGRCSKLHVGED